MEDALNTREVRGIGRANSDIAYWGISPEELAEQVIYAIDQPWGVVISDITVRASGENFVI